MKNEVPHCKHPEGNPGETTMTGGRRWRVAVADDHRVIRDGIEALLRGSREFEYAGAAGSGAELPGLVARARPHVLVLDLSMSGTAGADLVRTVRERHPQILVVVLTMHATLLAMQEAFAAGAHAFVAKDDPFEDFAGILRRVCQGERCISSRTLEELAETERAPQLTTQERTVLELVTRGYSSKEIGARLTLSQRTVEVYRANLFRKFNVTKITELAALALASGIVPVTPATQRSQLAGL